MLTRDYTVSPVTHNVHQKWNKPAFAPGPQGDDGGALLSPDGVAPSRMIGVSACVNLPLHHKVQKFSCGVVWCMSLHIGWYSFPIPLRVGG